MTPNQFFLYHDALHFFISAIIGILLWKIYRNHWVIVFSLLAGIFIDADHLFDLLAIYLNAYGPVVSLDKLLGLFYSHYMDTAGKVYVPLHSIDLLWVWWFVGRRLNKLFRVDGLQWAIPLSFFGHILLDYASYYPNPLAYFLTFRLFHGFDKISFDAI